MKIIRGINFGGGSVPGHPGGKPERIKIDAKCPVCGSLYDFGRLEVLREEDGASLMYIKCPVCQSATVSIIALGVFGIKVASAVTDLEKDEVLKFQSGSLVQSEEVLALHEELGKNEKFFEEIS